MTMPATDDVIRRDHYGRYLIVPPNAKKPVGYTRVTTVASTLDSAWGIADWKASMTVQGMLMRPGLRARWEAVMAENNGDAWYGSDAGKATCKELVEECAAVGGANDRREIGSALHSITALSDLGRTPTGISDETRRDLDAYTRGLAAAGVTLVPEHVELTVVLDAWKVAGTFDRLVLLDWGVNHLPLIADLKTGQDLSYGWQAISVQLAAYSRADAIYRQGVAANGSDDVRLPMPAVDQKHGLIMWLNAGTAQLELHLVDLEEGWEAFKKSMWVREWRNRKVSTPLKPPAPKPLAAVPPPPPAQVQVDIDLGAAHRAWLANRVAVIGRHGRARTELIGRWPADIPTLKRSDQQTPDQLAAIEALLNDVEKHWELPFPPPPPAMGRLLRLFPESTEEPKEEPQ